jgi:ATP-dependent DNA ligase
MGYRIHKSGDGVGSLLLGLYRDGQLHMVGGAASFTVKARFTLLTELQPLRLGAEVVYDGEPSRWNAAADKRWIPIRPERVAEVTYDQMEGDRFRHTVRFVRWRPDRDPQSCTFEQLEVPGNYDLYDVLES